MKNAKKTLVFKPEGKRPLGILRCKQEDIIKMRLREIDLEDVDWIYLVQDRDRW